MRWISCDAGLAAVAAARSQPGSHKGEQGTQTTHSLPGPPLCFRFQYSVEYVTRIGFAALRYKIGFVCNDFAQLGADVGVLSTFKIDGEVKLRCS